MKKANCGASVPSTKTPPKMNMGGMPVKRGGNKATPSMPKRNDVVNGASNGGRKDPAVRKRQLAFAPVNAARSGIKNGSGKKK